MKQIVKRKSRKGFTLVETLLATFILVVISTMLLNGFITTMGYSYQTSIYNKSAAKNYSLCMSHAGAWSLKSNNLDAGREAYAKNHYATNKATLNFITGTEYTSCESLYVGVERKSDLSPTVPSALAFQSEAFAPKDDDYVDNRTAIVYFPEYCDDGASGHVGEIVVMIDSSDSDDIHYYWVVAEPNTEDSTKNPYDENNKIKTDFDLSGANIIIEVGTH
jgi:prepilin-type N-terminal cleavage/methylation domain-containing protein